MHAGPIQPLPRAAARPSLTPCGPLARAAASSAPATWSQGFAKACLHASSKGLASNILVVLHQLHEAKRLGPAGGGSGALDSALARLYEPILFRWAARGRGRARRRAAAGFNLGCCSV